MTGAAMAQPLDEIGASIPPWGAFWVRCKRSLSEIELPPACHRPASIEWEMQMIDIDEASHRFQSAQVGEDRVAIFARNPCVEVVRHRRIHVLTSAIYADVQH